MNPTDNNNNNNSVESNSSGEPQLQAIKKKIIQEWLEEKKERDTLRNVRLAMAKHEEGSLNQEELIKVLKLFIKEDAPDFSAMVDKRKKKEQRSYVG